MSGPLTGPKLEVDLEWTGGLRVSARSGSTTLLFDSNGRAGASPVQALCASLASCMTIDVVHILEKGRVPLRALRAQLVAQRAADDPKRVLAVELHYVVRGDLPADKVERAIELSREKYCSVWHSLRQDIDFKTSFEVHR